jgi:hypothetical protein
MQKADLAKEPFRQLITDGKLSSEKRHCNRMNARTLLRNAPLHLTVVLHAAKMFDLIAFDLWLRMMRDFDGDLIHGPIIMRGRRFRAFHLFGIHLRLLLIMLNEMKNAMMRMRFISSSVAVQRSKRGCVPKLCF